MRLLLTCSIACILVTSVSAEDWLSFRGPNSAGVSNSEGVPVQWSDTENLAWKLDLPGKGYSSPIVVGDSVFVTCYSSDGDLSQLKRHVVRVNRASGEVIWSKEYPSAAEEREIPQFAGRPGFASHTPVSDGKRIYVLFGNSGVHALDLDGNVVWKKEVGSENRAMFGSAASPILYKDLLIVTAASESESIRAFNKDTGEQAWKVEAAALNKSYATPVIATTDKGTDELLMPVVGELWGLDPATGTFKWYCEARTDTAQCPCVVVADGVAYCLGGRSGGRTAIRIGGKDDVTSTHQVWTSNAGSYVPSPVVKGDHIYWINDNGIVTCVDRHTGKEVNKKRLRGQVYASILLIRDKLYAVTRYQGTFVLEATPELKQLAHNTLTDRTDHSASPAVADGQLFIRSDQALYCISGK